MQRNYSVIFSLILLVLNFTLTECAVKKRKYLKGWYVSSSHIKKRQLKAEKDTLSDEKKYSNARTSYNHISLSKKRFNDEESNEKFLTSNEKYNSFIDQKKVKEINDTIKRKSKIKRLLSKINFKYEPNKVKEEDHDILFPLLPLLLFCIGLVLITFSVAVLVYVLKDLFAMFILYGVTFLLISLALSILDKEKIKKHQLPRKLWPYNLIIGISVTIAIILALFAAIWVGALLFL